MIIMKIVHSIVAASLLAGNLVAADAAPKTATVSDGKDRAWPT